MSELLSSISKMPYQGYVIENGIDRTKIQIPLSESKKFEAAFIELLEQGDIASAALLDLVKQHGGSVRKDK